MVAPVGASLLIGLAAAALAAGCHGVSRGAAEYGTGPVRSVAGYPLRFRLLSDAERKARAREVMAKNPGWTVVLDEVGLPDFANRAGVPAGPLSADDRAALSAFLAANLPIVGLEQMPDLSTARPQGDALVLAQPGGNYQISFSWSGISGHFMPGWHAWPAPLTDDELLARFVGLPATARERTCSPNDGIPCDRVGAGDCVAPRGSPTSPYVSRAPTCPLPSATGPSGAFPPGERPNCASSPRRVRSPSLAAA